MTTMRLVPTRRLGPIQPLNLTKLTRCAGEGINLVMLSARR